MSAFPAHVVALRLDGVVFYWTGKPGMDYLATDRRQAREVSRPYAESVAQALNARFSGGPTFEVRRFREGL